MEYEVKVWIEANSKVEAHHKLEVLYSGKDISDFDQTTLRECKKKPSYLSGPEENETVKPFNPSHEVGGQT